MSNVLVFIIFLFFEIQKSLMVALIPNFRKQT